MTADNADPAEATACRRLWAAVALAALHDAEGDPLGPAGRYIASAEFRTLCCLAGLDPDAALQRIDRMRRDRLAAARQRQEAELTEGQRRAGNPATKRTRHHG